MRELDKHLEVNTCELEAYIAELKADQKSKSREKIFQFLLILIGIFGFFYVINSAIAGPLTKIETNKTSVFASSRYDSPPTNVNISPVVTQEAKSLEATEKKTAFTRNSIHHQLSIKGAKEAKEKLQFTIHSYNDKAKYSLDLGNGLVKSIANKSFSYTYQEAGDYQIKLEVKFENQSATIYEDRISIAAATETSFGVIK